MRKLSSSVVLFAAALFLFALVMPFAASALIEMPDRPDREPLRMQRQVIFDAFCERLGEFAGMRFDFCGTPTPPPAPPPLPPAPPPAPPPPGMVMINEIMYDLDGSDTNREWIEVVNGTDAPVDLSTWKLVADEADRALNLISGDAVIPAGGFAVISPNSDAFLLDWPEFSGTLFDTTVFVLGNTSETVAIKNGDGTHIDEVTYSSEQGGNGDGNSLQKFNNDWVGASPTPGTANVLP